MSLPRELRNLIYEYAVRPDKEGDGGIEGSRAILVVLETRPSSFSTKPDSDRYDIATPWIWQPAITKVSRQIRKETLPMYYGCNRFVIKCRTAWRWLSPREEEDFPIYRPRRRLGHQAPPLPQASALPQVAPRPVPVNEDKSWHIPYEGHEMWFKKIGCKNMSLITNIDVCFRPRDSETDWTAVLSALERDFRRHTNIGAALPTISAFVEGQHAGKTLCLPLYHEKTPTDRSGSGQRMIEQRIPSTLDDSMAFRRMPPGIRQKIFPGFYAGGW